ncbi:MAG TPA: replicative DNA helicase [Stellaceae bacterium]|nr:replicative DNA helicase [Stellaceae bacterium]
MSSPAPISFPPPAANEPALRSPPHNLDAEQALLGAILINNTTYQRVADYLLPEHFYNPVHQRIYAAIMRLIEHNQIADPVTLKSYFDQDGSLVDIGGGTYIAKLALSVVTVMNAGDYGRTIYDAYIRRQLIEIGTDTVNDAYEFTLDLAAPQQIEQTEKRLFDLATSGTADGGFKQFSQALTAAVGIAEQAFKRSGRTSGLSTGFQDIDAKLGGLHKSDLVILAGRPSMGKTALATNIAFNVAKSYRSGVGPNGERIAEDGGIVGFFSLEMSAEQLAARVLSEESGVPSDKIRRGEVGHDEFDRFVVAAGRLGGVPLHIDDTAALTIQGLRTRARRLKRQHGLNLIVVDYLQLIQGSARPGQEVNRVQELSEITRGLKALAKELDVPVLALSQLSRAVEQREDKHPQLADLRESGSIEQDADVVMFVFREEYYLTRAEPTQRQDEAMDKFTERHKRWFDRIAEVRNTAEAIIAKQRHGPVGSVLLTFQGEITKFSDYVGRDRLPVQY